MTPESRLEALRYFQAVLPVGDLRKWAETEYQSLQQLLDERKRTDAERTKNAGDASAAAATVDRALSELQTTPSDNVEKRVAEPAIEPLAVSFKAKKSLLAEAKDETYYTFSVAIDAPATVLSRIARVDYLFDHPTFTNKVMVSRDRSAKFEVSYRGWGCLSEVIATITPALRRAHPKVGSVQQCRPR